MTKLFHPLRLTIKAIMPPPPKWLVFHRTAHGTQVLSWHWQPVMLVAHVIDDEGVEAVMEIARKTQRL